jgi:hypothetical protein
LNSFLEHIRQDDAGLVRSARSLLEVVIECLRSRLVNRGRQSDGTKYCRKRSPLDNFRDAFADQKAGSVGCFSD